MWWRLFFWARLFHGRAHVFPSMIQKPIKDERGNGTERLCLIRASTFVKAVLLRVDWSDTMSKDCLVKKEEMKSCATERCIKSSTQWLHNGLFLSMIVANGSVPRNRTQKICVSGQSKTAATKDEMT